MSRTAIDEILDLNLGENTCKQIAKKIKQNLPLNFNDPDLKNVRLLIKGEVKLKNLKLRKTDIQTLQRLFFSLQLVQEDIADILDEIDESENQISNI